MAPPSGKSDGPDWTRLPQDRVMRLAGLCTRAGDALLLACSSDGGVYAPVIYQGASRLKTYARHDADIMSWIEKRIEEYEK
jgi:hypothetical protein